VIVFNFFLFRVLPGDPARAGIKDPRLTQENILAIQARFGLDKPVINCFERLNPIKTVRFVNRSAIFHLCCQFIKGRDGDQLIQDVRSISARLRIVNTIMLVLPAQCAIFLGTMWDM
jgi:ABC-type dipeptide/oligopeptide/nickel transport system permease component